MNPKGEGKCSDWKAWHDSQPVGPPKLFVTLEKEAMNDYRVADK